MSDVQTTQRALGRPRIENGDEPRFFDQPLYKLLEAKLPKYVQRRSLNVRLLAKNMGFAYQSLYRWLGTGRLTPDAAKALIKIGAGAIEQEDLLPFLFA